MDNRTADSGPASGTHRTPDAGRDRARVDHLDGLRGVAILAVLGVHWVNTYAPIGGGGYLGVDVFFVLSGFVITTVLWRGRDVGTLAAAYTSFLRRRVRRLYPALIGLVVVSPIAVALVPFDDLDTADSAWHAVLSFAQLTWLAELLGTNTAPFRQTWSLAMEWYFSLLWPLAVLAARRAGWTAGRLARASLAAAAVLYLVALPWGAEVFYFTPPGRFAEILAGGAVALLTIDAGGALPRRRATTPLALIAAAAFGVYVLISPFSYQDDPARFVGVPLAVVTTVLALAAAQHAGVVRSVLSLAPLALIGRVSYSLYLWHFLPIYLIDKDQIDLPAPVLGLAGVGVAVLGTALSYRYLERPFTTSQARHFETRP
ncbi:acyltransferase family protein [Nocardioides sp.]|uniref:acyltransferase family protein n=1 Tax=Nocardioides sp. TaxID=35761 RepID=UPI0035195501